MRASSPLHAPRTPCLRWATAIARRPHARLPSRRIAAVLPCPRAAGALPHLARRGGTGVRAGGTGDPPRRPPTTPQWQALPKNNNRADQGGLRGNPASLPPSPSHEQTAAYNRHGTARDGPPRSGRKREGKV